MGCLKCKDETVLSKTTTISPCSWGWGNDEIRINLKEAIEGDIAIILDGRGYLRLVDPDERGCMDHGLNTKINFCPFCGSEFNHSKEAT